MPLLRVERRVPISSDSDSSTRLSSTISASMLAHALDQQRLSQAIVDFVRAGVKQVFPLEINPGATEFFRKPLREKQSCGTAGISAQELVQPALKAAVTPGLFVVSLQFFKRSHERLGDIAPAIDAKTSDGWSFR